MEEVFYQLLQQSEQLAALQEIIASKDARIAALTREKNNIIRSEISAIHSNLQQNNLENLTEGGLLDTMCDTIDTSVPENGYKGMETDQHEIFAHC